MPSPAPMHAARRVLEDIVAVGIPCYDTLELGSRLATNARLILSKGGAWILCGIAHAPAFRAVRAPGLLAHCSSTSGKVGPSCVSFGFRQTQGNYPTPPFPTPAIKREKE